MKTLSFFKSSSQDLKTKTVTVRNVSFHLKLKKVCIVLEADDAETKNGTRAGLRSILCREKNTRPLFGKAAAVCRIENFSFRNASYRWRRNAIRAVEPVYRL